MRRCGGKKGKFTNEPRCCCSLGGPILFIISFRRLNHSLWVSSIYSNSHLVFVARSVVVLCYKFSEMTWKEKKKKNFCCIQMSRVYGIPYNCRSRKHHSTTRSLFLLRYFIFPLHSHPSKKCVLTKEEERKVSGKIRIYKRRKSDEELEFLQCASLWIFLLHFHWFFFFHAYSSRPMNVVICRRRWWCWRWFIENDDGNWNLLKAADSDCRLVVYI